MAALRYELPTMPVVTLEFPEELKALAAEMERLGRELIADGERLPRDEAAYQELEAKLVDNLAELQRVIVTSLASKQKSAGKPTKRRSKK